MRERLPINISSIPAMFVGIVIFLVVSHPAFGKQLIIDKGVIEKDVTWQGNILIGGDVEVAKGVTLTIKPGTVIRFTKIKEFGSQKIFTEKAHHFSRTELFIKGRMIARGTGDKKITFTSAEKSPAPGDWGSVNFLDSVDNILENCVFTYGQTSVHCHSAQVIIRNNVFKHNGTAIGQKNLKGEHVKCIVPISGNLITENGGGVLFGGGTTPAITHNEITNNVFFGIYVKKGGPAPIHFNILSGNGKGIIFYAVKSIDLTDNNIFNNTDYNISMLEGQTGDIVARQNWWGSTTSEEIIKFVMDKNRDATLGKVDFTDFHTAAVTGAGIQ